MTTPLRTNNLGYPRIGEKRELKKATEAYWKGKLSRDDLLETARELRRRHWIKQQQAGIDGIPSNDFSFYDQMLDMSCLLGNIPPRFQWSGSTVDLDTMFSIARGGRSRESTNSHASTNGKTPQVASEMTKWFDTNYHYIVPEFSPSTQFKTASSKIFDEFQEALTLGIKTRPVLIGPVTYLALGKGPTQDTTPFNRFTLLERLLPVYKEVLRKLADLGAEWVQLDEPILTLDLTPEQRGHLRTAYNALATAHTDLNLLVATYFGELRDNLDTLLSLPVTAIHIDAVRGRKEIDRILKTLPKDKTLSLGIVDGRNVWRNDFTDSLDLLKKAQAACGDERLIIAPSCSLMHSPVTLRNEPQLDTELKSWLAFSDEKLEEITTLRNILDRNTDTFTTLENNQKAIAAHRKSPRIHNPTVKQRTAAITQADLHRTSTFSKRREAQHTQLNLPPFPTTTIGSFPQTEIVRQMRTRYRREEISIEDYEHFIEQEIERCVRFQEKIGIDILVHGEFERNDMVEYFGQKLQGFAFTQNGWVQSYGSRYVKPPILYGDVSRPKPMTVRWSQYAQSLTSKPMKGMLTGPVTILQWSFVRNDQPRRQTAQQVALAIRDEVTDLENAGIRVIQIDEPAFREGLPLRKANWGHYLDWGTKAFRLSSSSVKDGTQIHTHMCYSEFNDIIEAIADLDADVITIETSRSNMELLEAFVTFKYPNEIGPGVYDIHSPRVPKAVEMENLMGKAKAVLPPQNLWVNPDCGLKTRQWEEVQLALANMIQAARSLREAAQ